MKRLLTLTILFLSSYAFSHNNDNHLILKGAGQWVNTEGETGKYKVMIEGTVIDNSITVTENYLFGEQSKSFIYTLAKKGHGFADIMKDGLKIGQGYCFVKKEAKICHQRYTYKGSTVENTCHIKGDKVKRIGSITGQNHPTVKFSDRLKKQVEE